MLTSGYDDTAAALFGTGRNGLVDGLLIFGRRIRGLGAILGDGEVTVGKLWHADALLNLLVLLVVPSLGLGGKGNEGAQQQRLK